MEIVVEGLEAVLVKKIKRARKKDEEIVKLVEKMKKAEVQNLRGNEWEIEGDLVLKEESVYVLKNEELRIEIIQLYYDVPVTGHKGRWKTTELVMRNYQWLEVIKDVGKYVEGYDLCQRIKNKTEAPAEKLMVNEIL